MSLLSLATWLTGVVFNSLRNAKNQVTLVSCMEVDSVAMDSPSCLAVAACLAAKTRSVFIVGRVCFVSVFFVTQGQKLGRNHGSLFELLDVVPMPDGVDAKRQFVTFEGCSGVDCRSGPGVS